MIRDKKALVLVVAVCSAFSGGTKETTSTASTSSGVRAGVAQATGPIDACAWLRKADVDAAFAPRVFGAGEKGRANFVATAKLATVAGCTYTSRGASVRDLMTVNILVRRAPTDNGGVTVAAAKDGAVKLHATPVDVPGLGDAAYWVNLGSSTRPVIQLNVFKGKRLWLVFGASALKLDTEAAVAGLTKVAKATLGRL